MLPLAPLQSHRGRWLTNQRTIIPNKLSHCWESSRTHNRLPNLGIWQRDWVSQGNLTWKVNRIWLQQFHRTGKQTPLENTNKTLCTPGSRRKEQRLHKRLSLTCLCVLGSLWWRCVSIEFCCGIRGTAYNSPGISPFEGGCHYYQCPYHSLASGQTTGREHSLQAHPSEGNWIKDLQSMTLPTRTRPSFPHNQSLPSGSLHKPLILTHQRVDRMKTTITEN